MTCNIIGCGETAKYWDGSGDSIGVNDCWKWGHRTDYLMVLDNPERFIPDRAETIRNSNPHHFITYSYGWLKQFYNGNVPRENLNFKELWCTNGTELIHYRFSQWKGHLTKDRIWYANTSPFPAISLAYLLGYTEIVLWGVDFINHAKWRIGFNRMDFEADNYKQLYTQLLENGVSVYLGHEGSMLETFIPRYEAKV